MLRCRRIVSTFLLSTIEYHFNLILGCICQDECLLGRLGRLAPGEADHRDQCRWEMQAVEKALKNYSYR